MFVIEWFAGKMYHFMVANLVLPRRVSGEVNRVFATVKWYNLCLQSIQTNPWLSHNDNNNEHFDEVKL